MSNSYGPGPTSAPQGPGFASPPNQPQAGSPPGPAAFGPSPAPAGFPGGPTGPGSQPLGSWRPADQVPPPPPNRGGPGGLPPGTVITVGLLVVALVIAAAWWFFGRTPAPRPRPTPLPTPSATPLAPGPTPSVDPSPASTSPGSSQTTPTIPINPGSNDLPVPTGPALPLGQPGLAGTYEYVVNSVQLSQRPILELFPPEGVYVIVNLTVTLRDDNPDPLVVFYNSNVALLDTGGVQHLVTGHSVMFDDALTIALLEPNDPVTGNVVFDLPPTATSGAALLAADQTLGHTVKLDLGLS